VDGDDVRRFADVFGDKAKGDTGTGSALAKLGLAFKLMGDGAVLRHGMGVEVGGARKLRVKANRRETSREALLVGSR
jgi:hypothetical protein